MKSDFGSLKMQAAGLRGVLFAGGRPVESAIVDDLLNALEATEVVLEKVQSAWVGVRYPQFTRVTVVGPNGGLAYESRDYHGIELHDQDDGRTLKIFPMGDAR
jgi:hypothetical protein